MSKRSPRQFTDPLDFVPTPPEVVISLIGCLSPGTRFHEPCAGDGALAQALGEAGMVCTGMSDIEPRAPGIERRAVAQLDPTARLAITNPPWARDLLVPVIHDMLAIFDTFWLLQPLDHLANLWMDPFRPYHVHVRMIGRVRWLPSSKHKGFENYAWILYQRWPRDRPITSRSTPGV